MIVVGSGAAGRIAAYVLATKGLNVLCLEAGRMLDPSKDLHVNKFPYEWPYRGDGKPGQYVHLPQGMGWKINELEYKGLDYLSEFPGCTHREYQT